MKLSVCYFLLLTFVTSSISGINICEVGDNGRMKASHIGYKCIDHQDRPSVFPSQVCECPMGRQCISVKDDQLNDIDECSKEHNEGLNLDKRK